MTLPRALRYGLCAFALGLVACGLTEPAEVSVQPSIVIELPPDTDSLFATINEAHFYITPPGGMVRDTLLRFEPGMREHRVRMHLRPDEAVAGTRIDLELKQFGRVLFTGSLELSGGDSWELDLVFAVEPLLTLTTRGFLSTRVGRTYLLSDLAWLEYADGTIATDETLSWSVSNPEAAEINNGSVHFPIEGSVSLTATWRDQSETIGVSIR